MIRYCLMLLVLICCCALCQAADMEITPFRTVNQSPLVQIFGLPAESAASVTPSGRFRFSLTQDVASHYTVSQSPNEQVTLDGESYRSTLAAVYGISDRFEIGAELPYVVYGGGFLDGFVIDWHKAFGLPQGGRDAAVKDRLNFSYRKDGVQKLSMNRSGSGIGDISLNAGMKLYDLLDADSHNALSVRTSLKLPTGESASLRGSGSTDFTLSLCGSLINFTEWGSLGLYGSLGGMALTKGDVLRDQQNTLAGFGSAGIGWGPARWISFKLQLNAHTPLYHGSSLDELSKSSLMLLIGGALKLPDNYLLDIGVSEDVAVATAPDVGFHLGLSKQF